MRKLIVLSLILLVGGLAGAGFTFAGSDFSLGVKDVDMHKELPAAGISKLKIESGSMDVTLVKGSGDVIEATATGKASGKLMKKIQLELTKEGETAIVRGSADTGFTIGINIVNVNLEVTLPARQYESILVDSGSGDIRFDSLEASVLELKNGSGNIEMSEIQADKVKTKNGSGNLSIEQSRMKELETTVGSGDISLTDVEGAIQTKTSSGNIRIAVDTLSYPLEAHTGSGNITVQAETAPTSATISYSIGSGSFRNDWDGSSEKDAKGDSNTVLFGGGDIPVKLSAGSGNISLRTR